MNKNKSYKWIERKQNSNLNTVDNSGINGYGNKKGKTSYYVHRGFATNRMHTGQYQNNPYYSQTETSNQQMQKLITLKPFGGVNFPFQQHKHFNSGQHCNLIDRQINDNSNNNYGCRVGQINQNNNKLNNIYNPPIYNDNYNYRKVYNDRSTSSNSSDSKSTKHRKNRPIYRPYNQVHGGNKNKKGYYNVVVNEHDKGRHQENKNHRREKSFCDRDSCSVCARVRKHNLINYNKPRLPPPPRSISYYSKSNTKSTNKFRNEVHHTNNNKKKHHNKGHGHEHEYRSESKSFSMSMSTSTSTSTTDSNLNSNFESEVKVQFQNKKNMQYDDNVMLESYYSYSSSSESCNCSRCKKKTIAEAKLKQKIMKKFGNKKIIAKLNATESSYADIKCDDIKCENCYR